MTQNGNAGKRSAQQWRRVKWLKYDAGGLGPQSTPEQQDQNDDQQDQPEATAAIMVWRAVIEASATEHENQKNQE